MQNLNYQEISSFKDRPSENIRYLIKRQLPRLVQHSISQASQFINTSQTKGKALQQLKYSVLIAETDIQKHLQKILKALVKIWQLEIQNVESVIKQIMKIVGYFVKSNFYIPLMINILKQDQIKNSPKNTIILLNLISYMLQTSEDIEAHTPQILRIITQYQQQFTENDDGLITILQIVITLTNRLSNFEDSSLVSRIFSVLLNVQSTKSISEQNRKDAHKSMELLAKKCGYSSLAQLHSNQVGPVLQAIIQTKQYVNWTKTSKNRFKFDTIVRNCQGEAKKFMNDILTIIQYNISLECDLQVRMDTLVLLQDLICENELQQVIREHGLRIIRKILNVAVKWKVGKPQIKIRKAGIINMIKLIENQLINPQQLLESLDDVLPNIKTCISDDWAPELRLACCQFLQKYLMATKQIIQTDKLKELYVILLERLDDSQDPIRKKITIPINLFFNCKSLKFSPAVSSTLEYMINAIFVHYDDSNPEIRDSINISLRFAAVVDPQRVLKSGKSNLSRMKHKQQCQQLIEYCEQILQQRQI